MFRRPYRPSVLGLGLALTAAWAVAQDERGPLPVTARFDKNNDGELSRAEFASFAETLPRVQANPRIAEAVFDRLDADQNGRLSSDEFRAVANFAGGGPRPNNPFARPGESATTPPQNPFARPGGNPFARPDNPFAKPGTARKPDTPTPDTTAEPTAEQLAFFEKKIRPVLAEQCYGCHSVADEQFKGGLALDTKNAILFGGDSGPSVIPGNPNRSPIVLALRGADGHKQMPPKKRLPDEVVADFETWVRAGAADPRTEDTTTAKAPGEIDIEAGKKHWAFQPPKKTAPPAVSDVSWPSSDIDRFVLAGLDAKRLTPAPDADRATLVRRVYFDLIGLPPSPDEVDAFVNDLSPDAFEKVVDRLLASPRFGERWGRHWLDVARYAESSGKEQNIVYPFAWRYRDWVIDAFNRDLPYDQFLAQQLAGDLLPAADDTDRANKLIATGYLAVGSKSHNTLNRTQFTLDLADEQIDAFTQGMLGLTVACARCHDHKFDPIPTEDYYAIAGIFTSTDTKYGTPATIQSRFSAPLQELPADAKIADGAGLSVREQEALRRRLDAVKEQRDRAVADARKTGERPLILIALSTQIGVFEKQLSNYDEDGRQKKLAMGVEDRRFPKDSPVYQRGEPDKPGQTVPRGFLQVLPEGPKIESGSGRKELAAWVASNDNPLTARVMANRVWLHLFGRGLVPTPDNFGAAGQPPSHPELLDHLAVTFATDDAWSIKSLTRRIVMSRTYRQSSAYDPADGSVDPDNVYLWRMSPRRLDAEAIRDAMLAVSGELDPTPAVGSPLGKFEGVVQGVARFAGGVESMADTAHRSVYLPIIRDEVPEALDLFDFAEPSLVTGQRDDTSVPAQGLYLLNNPGVIELSEKTAERLMKDYVSPTERINAGFRLAFGRAPTADEETAAAAFLDRFREAEKGRTPARQPVVRNPFRGRGQVTDEKAVWAAFTQALFAAAEFRYVD